MTYRLTRLCEHDIERIHLQGAERFGVEEAERYQDDLRATFELLGANPRLARERSELRRPVRLHPHRAHLIAYVEDGAGILIVRVFHGRQDWMRHLKAEG